MVWDPHLKIILWVPVRVENDTGVSSSQINAQTSSPRTKQEDKPVWIRFTEPIDGCLSQVSSDPPVNALIQVSDQTEHLILDLSYKPDGRMSNI